MQTVSLHAHADAIALSLHYLNCVCVIELTVVVLSSETRGLNEFADAHVGLQGSRPASQHRGEGEGALPENLNIGFSGKGSGIYAPFSAQKQTRSSYLGQPGEMEGEAPPTYQV